MIKYVAKAIQVPAQGRDIIPNIECNGAQLDSLRGWAKMILDQPDKYPRVVRIELYERTELLLETHRRSLVPVEPAKLVINPVPPTEDGPKGAWTCPAGHRNIPALGMCPHCGAQRPDVR